MTDHAYEEGKRDGRLQAIETVIGDHKMKFEEHNKRISTLERASYIVLGIILWLEFSSRFL